MNFLERLDMLKAARGDNNATLSKKSGIPYSTIDGFYKKGYENMKLSTLEALCEYFDVTLDYLAKGTNKKLADIGEFTCNEEQLLELSNPVERELLTLYRELNTIGQQTLLGTARGLHANPDMKKDSESNTTAK